MQYTQWQEGIDVEFDEMNPFLYLLVYDDK
jgi:hypothetical protein